MVRLTKQESKPMNVYRYDTITYSMSFADLVEYVDDFCEKNGFERDEVTISPDGGDSWENSSLNLAGCRLENAKELEERLGKMLQIKIANAEEAKAKKKKKEQDDWEQYLKLKEKFEK